MILLYVQHLLCHDTVRMHAIAEARSHYILQSAEDSTSGHVQKLGLADSHRLVQVSVSGVSGRIWPQRFQLVPRDVEPHHN